MKVKEIRVRAKVMPGCCLVGHRRDLANYSDSLHEFMCECVCQDRASIGLKGEQKLTKA